MINIFIRNFSLLKGSFFVESMSVLFISLKNGIDSGGGMM